MASYQDDQDRLMEELKHRENLAILADYCHLPPSKVLDFVRPRNGSVVEISSDDPNDVVCSLDFSGAPSRYDEVRLAEWAVTRVAELKEKTR